MVPDFRFLAGTLLLGLFVPAGASAYNASLKAQAHQYLAGEAYQCLPSVTLDQKAMRAEFAPYIGQRILWDAAGKNHQTVDGQEAWAGKFWTYTGDGEANPAWGLPYTSGYSLQYIDMTDDNDMANLTREPADDIIEGSFAEDYRDGISGYAVPTGALDPALWEFWDHHFWNPEDASGGEFSDDFGGGNGSAVNRAETYWRGTIVPLYDQGVLTYDVGAKARAYGYLGRTVHLLEDISGPDHAHNDGHMPSNSHDEWELPGLSFGGCGYEDYTSIHYADYQGSTALPPVSYRIDDTLDPFMSKARQEWNAHGFPFAWYAAKSPLFWLFYSQAEYANDYPSNDVDGERAAYNTSANFDFAYDWTWTNSSVGEAIADDLVPVAMRHVAGLYRLFYDTTHPLQSLVINNAVVGRTPESWFSGGLATSPAFTLNIAKAAGGVPYQFSPRPGLPYESVALVARPALYRDPAHAQAMYVSDMAGRLLNPAYRHPDWKVFASFPGGAAGYSGSFALPADGDYDLYMEATYRADPYALVDGDGHHGRAYTTHQFIGRVLIDRMAPIAPTSVTGPAQTAMRSVSVAWNYGQSPTMATFEVLVTRDTGNPNVIGTEVLSAETPYLGLTLPMPLEDGKYVVRVRARDGVGNTSAWAVSNVIQVDATSPKLALTSPTGASPYKKWDSNRLFRVAGWTHDWATGVGLKSLRVWNASYPRAPVYTVNSLVQSSTLEPDTSVQCTPLLCPIPIVIEPVPSWEDSNKQPFAYDVTVYDGPNLVHVRAEDLLGNVNDMVLVVNYSDPALNERPVLEPGLLASEVFGPAPLRVAFEAAITDPDLDDLTYTWDFGDGTMETSTNPYPWHVYYGTGNKLVTVTVTDVHGASVTSTLTITPQLPTISNPGSVVYGTPQWLAWSHGGPFVERYDVWLHDVTAGTGAVYYQTTNSWNCGLLTVGHSYQLQVRARMNGAYGPWSLVRSFTVKPVTPVTPTLLSPIGNVSNLTPTFSWSAVVDADQYQVQVLDATGAQVALSPSTGQLSWQLTQPLVANGTYSWRARARIWGVFKAWSDPVSFTPRAP